MPPLVVVEVKPARRTLLGVLQQASAREAEQSPLVLIDPDTSTQVPA
jgi:hypothetical protein